MTTKAITANTETTNTQGRVAAAQTVLAATQEHARLAALAHRDMADCVRAGVFTEADAVVQEAEREWQQAKKSLHQARLAVRHAEADRAHSESEMKAQAIAAEQRRRLDWVRTNRADLSGALEKATGVERELLASRFVLDSASGQRELALARWRVVQAREAIERAAAEVSAEEVNHAAG